MIGIFTTEDELMVRKVLTHLKKLSPTFFMKDGYYTVVIPNSFENSAEKYNRQAHTISQFDIRPLSLQSFKQIDESEAYN